MISLALAAGHDAIATSPPVPYPAQIQNMRRQQTLPRAEPVVRPRPELRRLPPPDDGPFGATSTQQANHFAAGFSHGKMPLNHQGAYPAFRQAYSHTRPAAAVIRGQYGCYDDCDSNCHWVGLLGTSRGPGGRPVSYGLYDWIADHPVLSYTAITAAIVLPIIAVHESEN